MLRLVGAAMIITGAGYASWQASGDLIAKTRQIQELTEALKALERELAFRLTPLPELLFSVGSRTKGPLGAFFIQCSRHARSGDGMFAEHWDREAEGLKDRLDAYSMDCLSRLGHGIGRYHWEESRELIASLAKELEIHLQNVRQENIRKGQVYRTLGITAGAFLIILFL